MHTADEPWTITAHDRSYQLHRGWPRVDRHARHGRPYERALLERIYRHRPSGVAVDVGANIGNHTLWFAVVCQLQVVAFEPVWPVLLAENVHLNGLDDDQVKIVPAALGADENVAAHTERGRLAVGVGEIPVWPLDAFQLSDVDVVKIDVEGMEPQALAGARATLARCRPLVYAEELDVGAHERHDEILRPLGYRFVEYVHGEGGTPVGEWQPQ